MTFRSVLLLLSVQACSWIPADDYAERFDLDGDGVDGLVDCDDGDASLSEGQRFYADEDGDGFGDAGAPIDRCQLQPPAGAAAVAGDCDDADPTVHPDAGERCNGVDDDCDGIIDDDDDDLDRSTASAWLPDADEDGFVSDAGLEQAVTACDAPDGFAAPTAQLDCDDDDGAVHPDAAEACGDGIDNDCDGLTDDVGIGAGAFYADADQDGWPDDWTLIEACEDPQGGLVREPDAPSGTKQPDCDPTDPEVNPGATETWYDGVDSDCDGADDYDADGDGARDPRGDGADCDDADPSVYPGAPDAWYDGIDADCAGDDDFDQDGDGVARLGDGGDDCDDTDAAVFPGAQDEWYDGVDSDCAGNDDFDQDADGYVDPRGGGYDCDDTDATRHPDAVDEWYDGVDADCAGNDDFDQDRDGERHPSGGGDDCDDTDPSVRPGAEDAWYDGVDSDCDGADDFDQDGDGALHVDGGGDDCDDTDPSWYPGAPDAWYDGDDTDCAGNDDYDLDGDGYRHASGGGNDCDDTDAAIHPGAVEQWYDGIDADCAGDDDYDQDGDGRTPATAPLGTRDDCDDLDPETFAGAAEIPDDGIDQDCNLTDAVSCYTDADLDGFGRVLVLGLEGTCDGGLVETSGDCDDSDPETWPGAPELCDSIDQDCDGTAQGFVASATLRSGDRVSLGDGDTVDGVDAERIDLCGGTWDLQVLWDPADGDLTLAGHPSFPQPTLASDRPLVVGAGIGRNTLTIEDVSLAYDAPTVTAIEVLADPLERAGVVIDTVTVSDNRLDRITDLVDVDLVIADTVITDSEFTSGAVAQTGGTLQLFDSSFTGLTRTPTPGGGDGAILEATDVFGEVVNIDFVDNVGRAAGFWDSRIVMADTTWEDNWYDPRDVDNTFVDADGGALYLERSELDDERSEFRRNSTLGRGGAVAAIDSELTFVDATFADNGMPPAWVGDAGAVERGGALAVDGDLTLDSCTVTDSTAALQGGSLYHTGSALVLTDGTEVLRSTLTPGNLGGVAIYADGRRVTTTYDGTITGFAGEETSCIEVHTTSSTSLQGLAFTDCDTLCLHAEGASSLTVSSSDFVGCNGDGGDGSALRATDIGYLDLYSTTYQDNHSTGDGGAVYTDADYLELDYGVEFVDNVADGSGGAIYAPDASAEVCDASFVGNTAAVDGGALYTGGRIAFGESLFGCDDETSLIANHADGRGGGVYIDGGELELHEVAFVGNTADAGGAAFVEGYVDGSTSVTMNGNQATSTGGAIHNVASSIGSDFYSLEFRSNVAELGGAVYFEGPGWSEAYPPALFSGTTFVGNDATAGSAVYMSAMYGFFEIPGVFSVTLSDTFTGEVVLDGNTGGAAIVREGDDGTWTLDVEALSAQSLDDQGAICNLPLGSSTVTCDPGEACVCP